MSTHEIGDGGRCVRCRRVVERWDEQCVEREPHTPFHGKPNEPVTFAPHEIPKT